MIARLQEFIYRFEMGSGTRVLSKVIVSLALLAIVIAYNLRGYQNMSNQEAMDTAQLARNIAEGKGYSTLFIRPISLYLVSQQRGKETKDPGMLAVPHPDLANAPVYPAVLASLMKVLPFDFKVITTKRFWSRNGSFFRFQPDFLISLFNQALFLGVVALTFLLARKLFDSAVAWLSAVVLIGADLYWRFAVSGLSTILLMLFTVLLAWVLARLEEEAREPQWGKAGFWMLVFAAGAIVGLGALTRYPFGWLIIPVVVFIGLICPGSRKWAGAVSLMVFLVLTAPWIARNVQLSGTPFGVATFAPLEDSYLYPESKLQRSLNPNLETGNWRQAVWSKFTTNARLLLQEELPRLGGTWVGAFFIVSLLIVYRKPSTARLRYFLIAAISLLAVIQALGRTQISDNSPVVNSENLLVLFGPIIIVYGVSFFFLLLDQLNLPGPPIRYLIIAVFVAFACAPMLFTLFGASRFPVAYPPYHPPMINFFASGAEKEELTMSDIPWAVAWYGQRQSVWMTLKAYTEDKSEPSSEIVAEALQPERAPEKPISDEDILAIRDSFNKRVVAILLSPVTTQGGVLGNEETWAHLAVLTFTAEVPSKLPFAYVAKLPSREHIIVADFKRWPREKRKQRRPTATHASKGQESRPQSENAPAN